MIRFSAAPLEEFGKTEGESYNLSVAVQVI
jgi:hypothetical protein